MDSIADSTVAAVSLLLGGDAELWGIIGLSLAVSTGAVALATFPAVALAYLLAEARFPGRRALIVSIQGLLSFPTVVVGLVLYLLLSRRGPLGAWDLIFTPQAMVIGQFVIAFPILAALSFSALQKNDVRVRETARTLGAGRAMVVLAELREARFAIVAAVLAGFGRVISEVGCALMVGGNIAGHTRNIPTAIALETSKGKFSQGIALGIVLLVIALGVSAVLGHYQGRGERR